MPIHAAIDVGSNAVKLHVAERRPATGDTLPATVDTATGESTATWRILHDQFAITSLGRGLAAGNRLDPAASERTIDQIACFVGKARAFGANDPILAGTMCLRLAADGNDFVAAIHERTALRLQIVSGHEEARLTYLALVTSLPRLSGAVLAFDIGGGSTEVMALRDGELLQDRSLDLGCLPITESHLGADLLDAAKVQVARRAVAQALAPLTEFAATQHLVGIGATAATLAAVAGATTSCTTTAVHGRVVTRGEIERQIELYGRLTVTERRRIPGLHPDRADVILAGAMITAAVMAHFDAAELVVCAHDLRLGLLVDRFGAGLLVD